jgi:photosystem II stability/assembly factor-like uncharacterized protein
LENKGIDMRLFTCSLSPRYGLVVFLAAFIALGCQRSKAGWKLIHSENLSHAAALERITFDEKGNGWVLTWAELSRVSDHGNSWIPVLTNQNGQRTFYSFVFTSPMAGVVVGTQKKHDGYNVLILQTTDGGKNWEERPTDVKGETDRDKSPALQSVAFCDFKNGWAVGEHLILHTNDGGLTWLTQPTNLDGERLFTVACANSERAWAAGTGGLLLETSDGGKTWIHREIGAKGVLMQVRFFGTNGWIVGGTNGLPVLLRTRNGGDSWQSQPLDVTSGLFDIFFLGSHGWIAGEKGTLLESDDEGQTWSLQKTPTEEDLTSLFFLSPDQGWVGGNRLTLLRFSRQGGNE